MFKQRSPVF
uniref:Uncharacterized protein n=1 Tax=Anguilla anguilla TaxID=7936 RepID=A0A0E9P585_ANGAN